MDTKEIKLNEPLIINGEELSTLIMKKPTIGIEEDAYDMCIALKKQNNPLSVEACSLAKLCNLTYDQIRSLSRLDHNLLRATYENFFMKKTEEKESNPVTGIAKMNSIPSEEV